MTLDPELLKFHRTRLGLTQAEVAERANMPQPSYARIESGRRCDPRLSTALAVAKALRKPIGRLIRDS